ncbi:hypothetical protein LNKW23_45520 [Paralimibaculum aggregatum]|uniref:Metallopeptidase DUF4344 n=1 Tax=Paralimibaculum aggregatum TaxID=3036245 RepID=A0ABQ6LTE3_9RHOB|nr:DUF4344 domain-containing metallopeptidase [Limibaculum sp. NKW23]GMG85332.1 hypothetical protein LNKW23_45520 [Limibaculum sp. NKW23]
MALAKTIGTLLLAAALGLGPGGTAGGPARAQTAAHDTGDALGAVRAVFYHELGHGLIDVLGLDVVGAEESVVDEFSTMLLILQGRRDRRHLDALIAAARFWYLSGDPARAAAPYWASHEIGPARGFAVLCLMHGSDPARFHAALSELGVPGRRMKRCETEYAAKSAAWINILNPHVRPNAPAARQGRMVPAYGPAGTPETEGVRRIWQQAGFLEGLAAEAGAIFPLPAEMPLTARDCGEANAFWDGQGIVLCYEMHAMIAGLFRSARGGDGPAPGSDGIAVQADGYSGSVNLRSLFEAE